MALAPVAWAGGTGERDTYETPKNDENSRSVIFSTYLVVVQIGPSHLEAHCPPAKQRGEAQSPSKA